MPNDNSRTTADRDDSPPFTLTPPANPQDAVLYGGRQGDQPAGAIERVHLQRLGRIVGPDTVRLFVEAIPHGRSAAVRVELRDRQPSPDGPQHAVTHIIDPGELIAQEHFSYEAHFRSPHWSERILAGLCQIANALYRQRAALLAGEAFIRETVDYRDPESALALLRDRGCEIHDAAAVRALVEADPGLTYYGTLDLDENGDSWERSGGPWIDAITAKAAKAGALTEPPERA